MAMLLIFLLVPLSFVVRIAISEDSWCWRLPAAAWAALHIATQPLLTSPWSDLRLLPPIAPGSILSGQLFLMSWVGGALYVLAWQSFSRDRRAIRTASNVVAVLVLAPTLLFSVLAALAATVTGGAPEGL